MQRKAACKPWGVVGGAVAPQPSLLVLTCPGDSDPLSPAAGDRDELGWGQQSNQQPDLLQTELLAGAWTHCRKGAPWCPSAQLIGPWWD